jgi:magnesium and cobalt transporter
MTELPQSANQSSNSSPEMPSGRGGLRQLLRGLFGGRNGESSVRETIEGLIEEPAGQAAAINPEESALIANILKLPDLTAEDVMIPRADIVAIDETSALHTVADLIGKEAHSRLPIFRGQLDDVVGFVHIKDVLTAIRTSPHEPVSNLQREILFAAPSIRVLDLLLEMRAQRTHMAIVVDEFGGVDGLVTIEDLVEEIVGEIEDEHDEEDGPTFARNPDGSILADARVEIEDLEELIGPFLTEDEREESDTLGGIVFALIDRVPRRSEVVTHSSGIEFEVVDADARRIKLLRVRDQRPGDTGTPNS